MSSPSDYAFQMIDPLFAGDGSHGTAPHGTAPHGGTLAPPYYPPELNIPSDDPQDDLNLEIAEITHERYGIEVGVRKVAERRRWRCALEGVKQTDGVVAALRDFWRARRFRLLPHGNDTTQYYTVLWQGSKFEDSFERQRGPYFNMQFVLVEVDA